MSITAELRRYVDMNRSLWGMYQCAENIARIADRIDKEHKRLTDKAHADGERSAMKQVRSSSEDYRRGYAAGYAKGQEDGMDNIDGGTEVERIEGSSRFEQGSSITDELREWMRVVLTDDDPAHAIADRIDAAHAKAVERARMDGMDETFGNGWVKLPVDADGVPIHVGDRVENNERVVRIVLTDDSWEPSVYVEKLPNVLHEYFCHEVSHYQPDSWERIIADATAYRVYDKAPCSISELVERCRRLAGEA